MVAASALLLMAASGIGRVIASTALGLQVSSPKRRPDVIYVTTPEAVVDAMLKAANVTKEDLVYDLGCGDGRIVVAAPKSYGARGIGIDIDPQRIKEASENVKRNGVGDRVEIRQADLFESDFRDASVVTLYLLPSLNLKLRPKLWKELKVGTRVVSHAFDMGEDWKPEQQRDVDGQRVYLWTITDEVKRRAGERGLHDSSAKWSLTGK
jgi:tRNA A58 N-methylase Trm61